jgi:DNA-binding beta-propeller fold protein YncE
MRLCVIRRLVAVWVLTGAGLLAQQAPIPQADELSGRSYVIKNTWVIGGTGAWDYLTLDATARQLFVTHQTEVQVVDIDSGQVSGRIMGFGEARAIVLDPDGQFGYVSDSGKHEIKVFDRRSLRIEKTIPLDCSPRSMTLSAEQNVLVAICPSPVPASPADSRPGAAMRRSRPGRPVPPPTAKGDSLVALIDTDARAALVYLFVGGDFHIAQSDRDGSVYVTVGPALRDLYRLTGTFTSEVSSQSIARIDVAALAEDARLSLEKRAHAARPGDFPAPHWDSDEAPRGGYVRRFPLDSSCPGPQGLAVDSQNARLFVGCDNQNLLVLDSNHGSVISTLTTGPGTDAIAYDSARKLIFTANGGGYGSVTIIRQHLSDSYTVIQNLPTLERARTIAVDPTGLVYLVTTLYGANLKNPPMNGIGTLKLNPVDGSFQVLVVGN